MDYDFSQIKKFIKNNPNLLLIFKIIIVCSSLYFISIVFFKNFIQIQEQFLTHKNRFIWFISISSLIYIPLLALLAKAWKEILESLHKRKLSNSIFFIYLRSQIYKYLPGNIFHYADRQIKATKLGISHKNLLESNFYEIIGLLSAAIFASIPILSIWQVNLNSLLIVGIVSALMLLLCILSYFISLKIIAKSIPYYFIYFILIGTICFIAVNYLTNNNITLFTCIALYATSWFAGFIIPGAPGGVGVRESIFIILTNNVIQQPEAIFIIATLRISTTLGELFAYFLTFIPATLETKLIG